MSGALGYHAGLAAEDIVARHYEASGARVLASRWRGRAGEVDLVLQDGSDVIFVEVKASATHDQAAQRLTPRQIGRVTLAAQEYLEASSKTGSGMRVDAALVDRQGRVETLKNISMV